MFLMLARKEFQKMVVVQLLQLKERYDRNYISCSDIHMPLFLHVFIACFFWEVFSNFNVCINTLESPAQILN